MHSRLRIKKEKRASAWDVHGGGGGGGGGSPMKRSNSRGLDDPPPAPTAGPLATSSSGVGAGLATRLGLALLRALALLRPAAAVLELLARALRLITSAVATRGRSERQRELVQWLRRGSGAVGAREETVQDLGAVWRNGHLLCAAVNAVVPGACPAADAGIAHSSGTCDFFHAQHVANKYLGVAPAFSETEVKRVASGGEAPSVRRLERYLRGVRRAANRLQFATNNPAVAWTLPPPPPQLLPPPGVAAAEDSDADESSSRKSEAACGRTHRARGTGLVAAVRGRRALFTVLTPRQQTSDLLIQVQGPTGDIGQKLIRATPFRSGSKENDGSASVGRSNRRATFSLKPWFSSGEKRLHAIPVETRVASGSVKVCYVPRSAGLHQVSLLSHGRHVAESPYNVMVDVRAGATEAPDFTEPWWTAAGDASTLPTSTARRVRIVYRVVDFVTEKMLLTNDGKLQKIPPNAPPPLLRALSLPDIRPTRPSSEDDSSDSGSDTFYDSQSDACASSSSSVPPPPPPPPPKRDPEFFRKQYRKVLHMCRFLAHNKPNRRSLEILSTAGRLLDGRPVRLPPEFHSLLARILSESIENAQRMESRPEEGNVGLNSISELMEHPEDDRTRRSRLRPESKDPVHQSEREGRIPEGDAETDTTSKELEESDSTLNVRDDVSKKSLRESLECPSKSQTANERNSSDELHILRSDSAHNSQSEDSDHDQCRLQYHDSIISNRQNEFDECLDDVSNEVESPPHEEHNIKNVIDTICLLPQISSTARNHEPQSGDLISSELENPDNGINLSKTVTQSGFTKRPNVLQLRTTFAPHHLSDCDARVAFDGQEEEKEKNKENEEQLSDTHTSATTNNRDSVSPNVESREVETELSTEEHRVTSVELSIDKDSLEEEEEEKQAEKEEIEVCETIEGKPKVENDADELNSALSVSFLEKINIPKELPGDIVGLSQHTTLNELSADPEVTKQREANSLVHLSNKCPEIQSDQGDDHHQFPGRPPEDLPRDLAATKAGIWSRPPAPPSSPPPTPPPPSASSRRIVPRGEPPREPAPAPPTPRDVPQRTPRDVGVALDRPPPNMDAVLSAASLEEALARFEQQAQEAAGREADHSPQGGAFGSSNGTSSCRSWDKGDSDYVSMEDIQSSLHHSPEGGMSGGEDLAEDWMRFLTVDYAPDSVGPAEEEIWSSIERRAQDFNDHPVSDWVSNLMPSNRYHPRVLSPGIHPMTSIREESEDRSSPASPTSPTPSPFKLLETQRSLQTSPFLSVTSPSPEKGEEQFDSFEWRPQIMAPDDQVVVGSLIDFENTAALKADVDSSNKSLCGDDNKLQNTTPQSDLLDFLLSGPIDSSNDAKGINETLKEDKDISPERQEHPQVNAGECIDEVSTTGQGEKKLCEGNHSKIGDIDIEAWKSAIDEYLAPSSLDSWESIRHPEQFSTPTCEDDVSLNEATDNSPSTGIGGGVIGDNSEHRDTKQSTLTPSITNESTEIVSSVPDVTEECRKTNDQRCEKSCCSRELLSLLANNQGSASLIVPEILIEDIDLLLTPCASPQLNSSFEEIDQEEGKDIEASREKLLFQGDQVKSSAICIAPNELLDDFVTNASQNEVNTIFKSHAATEEYSEIIEEEKQLNFDSPTSESAEKSKFSDAIAKSQRMESKFRVAASENCSVSQWRVESSADIVPSPIRVTQWKQFWDQKAASQKKKEEFKTSGVQRTIKRGSTHLEYLKCCHSNNTSPQRKRQHPSIRIPGIVSKWRKSFESVVDANKVAREFMKLRNVKKRKSILPSYNVEQEQIIYVDDAKSNTISAEAEVSVKTPTLIPLKKDNEKSEWPESNLVTSRKKKFEIGEPVPHQRRTEYFKTIPPRNKAPKVTEYRKFWDNLSKGQSCGDINSDGCTSGLIITEEIIIDEVPLCDVNETTLISESNTNETKPTNIPCYLDSIAEKEKSRSLSDFQRIDASPARKLIPTSTLKESQLNDTIKHFESESEPMFLIDDVLDETPPRQPPTPHETASLDVQSPSSVNSDKVEATGAPPPQPPPPPPRHLHIVNAEEMWYRARRIPIEEVEGASSGSDEPSRSCDESDQSWSIVEEGAESQPDSLTDTCSLSSHRAAAPRPPPPPVPPPHSTARAAANRSNREARSRFENAKLFFQNLESGGGGGGGVAGTTGMGLTRRQRRLRGGTDLDTSTDDTGSEGGGSARLPRTRRRCGGGAGGRGGGGGGAQSDTETLLLLSRERVRVPRGLFHDVRRGAVPQSRELLAALAAVDSRPASPYEEAAAAAAGSEDAIGGVTLAPSPSPPASPAPRSPLPHAYDQEYPYLPATDPRHFRPRSTLKSFAWEGVHIPL